VVVAVHTTTELLEQVEQAVVLVELEQARLQPERPLILVVEVAGPGKQQALLLLEPQGAQAAPA